ncbi:MAG: hypothetical protein WED86_06470, partial [Chloroflexota bacterium]
MTRYPGAAGQHPRVIVVVSALILVTACSGPLPPDGSPTPRPPRELTITIVDRTTETPVANAT